MLLILLERVRFIRRYQQRGRVHSGERCNPMVKGMYCRMDFLGRHGKSIIPFLGKVFLGSAQVLSVDYRKDDFNEIVLYNECALYLVERTP